MHLLLSSIEIHRNELSEGHYTRYCYELSGENFYDFDEFGFDVNPTNEQFAEWLEQLRFVKDEIEPNLDASEFFEEGGF